MQRKIPLYLGLLVAVVGTVAPEAFAYAGLSLVLLGAIDGFMAPIEDAAVRVAYYVLAASLPTMADHLDAIPVAGAYLNGFLDQMAVFIAGVALANIVLQSKKRVMPA